MAVLDVVTALILAYGAWRGWQQGFVVVFINTIALLVAIIIGLKFLHQTTDWLSQHVPEKKNILPILAFGILFSASFFGLKWLGVTARKTIRLTLLGPVDRFAGALFSSLKMALIISSLLFGLKMAGVEFTLLQDQKMVLFPAILQLGPQCFQWLTPLLPFLKKLL